MKFEVTNTLKEVNCPKNIRDALDNLLSELYPLSGTPEMVLIQSLVCAILYMPFADSPEDNEEAALKIRELSRELVNEYYINNEKPH